MNDTSTANLLDLFVSSEAVINDPHLAVIASYANRHPNRDYVCHMAVIATLEANGNKKLFEEVIGDDDDIQERNSQRMLSLSHAVRLAGGSPVHGGSAPTDVNRLGLSDSSSDLTSSSSSSDSDSDVDSDSEKHMAHKRKHGT
jgi:hypothetical protein